MRECKWTSLTMNRMKKTIGMMLIAVLVLGMMPMQADAAVKNAGDTDCSGQLDFK